MATMPLRLDAYLIDVLEVETLSDFEEGRESVGLNVDVQPQYLICETDPSVHQLVLTVPFGPTEQGSAPYRGRIVGRAFFSVSEDLDPEQTAQYVIGNGSAILLGLLRAQISQVTALGRWGTLLLPPVNLNEAFTGLAGDEEGEDETGGRVGLDSYALFLGDESLLRQLSVLSVV